MNPKICIFAIGLLCVTPLSADLNPNLRTRVDRPNQYDAIINYANPQEPLRDGPLCCDTPVFDVGLVASVENMCAYFPVTNEGEHTIEVDIKRQCGGSCATQRETIRPGQTIQVPFCVGLRYGNGPFSKRMSVTLASVLESAK